MPFVEDGEEDSDDEEDYDGGGRADQLVVHDEVSATVRLKRTALEREKLMNEMPPR